MLPKDSGGYISIIMLPKDSGGYNTLILTAFNPNISYTCNFANSLN